MPACIVGLCLLVLLLPPAAVALNHCFESPSPVRCPAGGVSLSRAGALLLRRRGWARQDLTRVALAINPSLYSTAT